MDRATVRAVRLKRQVLNFVFAAAVGLAACDASGPSSVATDLGTQAPSASASAAAASLARRASPAASTPASARPSTAAASASPRPSTTAAPTVAPTGSAGTATCTGSDANRTFYANTAAAVAWDLFCPVLPKGWNMDSGVSRAASGGTMTISYKTSAGLRLELIEGYVCTGAPAHCGPLDSTIGTAAYGDRQGTLGRRSGNLVLYVDPGSNPSWQATGVGLDEATFRALCAAFLKVPG